MYLESGHVSSPPRFNLATPLHGPPNILGEFHSSRNSRTSILHSIEALLITYGRHSIMAPVKYQEILIDEQDKSWGTLIKVLTSIHDNPFLHSPVDIPPDTRDKLLCAKSCCRLALDDPHTTTAITGCRNPTLTFLVQAVVAEYTVTTLFLFFTIGTVSSNW